MDMHAGHGEGMSRQKETVSGETHVLKSFSELKDAISKLGHNRLNERGLLGGMSGGGKWLETVQSEIIDGGGAAIAYIENGEVAGFVLADREGRITQFRCLEGKEDATLEHALGELTDKGFDHPTVQMTQKSETMQLLFEHSGFHVESEENEEGKIVMKKE